MNDAEIEAGKRLLLAAHNLDEVKEQLEDGLDELMLAFRQISETVRAKADRLVAASEALYMAGRWTAGLPSNVEAGLWEALRDALDLEPGTATEAGV